ncbi:glycine receptor subunit alpha-2-like [Mytilus edulis]|uniref:glycine receptor subunit alpha-2-like n=1 Tax=Mytilus edulis TaxID=6550 RepID=UPI0039EF1D28
MIASGKIVKLILLTFITLASSNKDIENTSKAEYSKARENVLKELFKDTGYDPTISPSFNEDGPVVCQVQLYIMSINSISDSSMDYSMSMFIRQQWNDSRLMYNESLGITHLELDTKVMKNVWVPDLFINNEKKANIHHVTVPNMLMHIYPDGKVVYSMRVTGTFTCEMNLLKYPLDTQICSMGMESYGYSTENLVFEWNENPISYPPNMSLPQFELDGITTYNCDKNYVGISYTCLKVDITLSRNYGYHIIQIYVPSFLIVFLSWVSFWLNIDAIPARISLGLLTVLTMTTQSSGARASLPKVSYVKAIDVWMAMCLLFVFGALVEFAYVNVLARVERRRQATISERRKVHTDPDANGEPVEWDKAPRYRLFLKSVTDREKARVVDKVSRVAFPLVFVTFNIIYWTVYIFWEPVLREGS